MSRIWGRSVGTVTSDGQPPAGLLGAFPVQTPARAERRGSPASLPTGCPGARAPRTIGGGFWWKHPGALHLRRHRDTTWAPVSPARSPPQCHPPLWGSPPPRVVRGVQGAGPPLALDPIGDSATRGVFAGRRPQLLSQLPLHWLSHRGHQPAGSGGHGITDPPNLPCPGGPRVLVQTALEGQACPSVSL